MWDTDDLISIDFGYRAFHAQSAAAPERFRRADAETRLFRGTPSAVPERLVRRRATGQTADTTAARETASASASDSAAVHQAAGVVRTGTVPAVPVPGGSVPATAVPRAAVPDQQRVRARRQAAAAAAAVAPDHRAAAGHVPANVPAAQRPVQDHAHIHSAHHRSVAAAAAAAVLERQRAGAVRGLLGTRTDGRISSGPQGQGAHPR